MYHNFEWCSGLKRTVAETYVSLTDMLYGLLFTAGMVGFMFKMLGLI